MTTATTIPVQTVVRGTDGRLGVVAPDLPGWLGDNEPGEVTVYWYGEAGTHSNIDPSTLEIVGPENAVASINRCGAGLGEMTCRFLTMLGDTPTCMRFGDLRWTLIFASHMRAKREPREAYPDCQLPEEETYEALARKASAEGSGVSP